MCLATITKRYKTPIAYKKPKVAYKTFTLSTSDKETLTFMHYNRYGWPIRGQWMKANIQEHISIRFSKENYRSGFHAYVNKTAAEREAIDLIGTAKKVYLSHIWTTGNQGYINASPTYVADYLYIPIADEEPPILNKEIFKDAG